MLLFITLLTLSQWIEQSTANYCHYGAGIFKDNNSQCLRSEDIGLANCCFLCTRDDGYYYCGSLLQLGGASCLTTSAPYIQAQQLCNGSSFKCSCTPGSDSTEFDLFAAGVATTRHPTNHPINSPSGQIGLRSILDSSLFILFVITAFVITVFA